MTRSINAQLARLDFPCPHCRRNIHGLWGDQCPTCLNRVRILCPFCSYNMRGLPTSRCPECGGVCNAADCLITLPAVKFLHRTTVVAVLVLALGLLGTFEQAGRFLQLLLVERGCLALASCIALTSICAVWIACANRLACESPTLQRRLCNALWVAMCVLGAVGAFARD